ncbi:hypothetical protein [Pseudomonas syringae]|uniref:hypothetical protein n=1 Tax=Pseudomonas syringae TaxID=317 RepID=UPI000A251DCE|nr:hypothetical protein [Pseudomonas syringae]OSR69474.1 hypothetical protein BV327_04040 [Pseudomonas syringae pv. actinidiae]
MKKKLDARSAPVDIKALEVLKRHEPITVVMDAYDIHALEKQILADTEMWKFCLQLVTERYPGELQNRVNDRSADVANRLLWRLKPLAIGPLAEAIADREEAIRQWQSSQTLLPTEPE